MEVPPAPHWYSTSVSYGSSIAIQLVLLLFFARIQTGTVVNVRLIPSSFDPKADAKALREAMQGLGESVRSLIL